MSEMMQLGIMQLGSLREKVKPFAQSGTAMFGYPTACGFVIQHVCISSKKM